MFLTAPFSGLALFSVRSNLALIIGPGGVLSCVTYGSDAAKRHNHTREQAR